MLAVDQDWETTINDIIRTWDTTAGYMIKKRDVGLSMMNAQEAFMARSTEAIRLPIALYTHRKTPVQAIAECQEITALSDTWCAEANRYYSFVPNTVG